MQLLLFTSQEDKDGIRLVAAVHKALPLHPIQMIDTLTALQNILCTVIEPESIAVLLASSYAELKQMASLRALLTEIFVVLVVPDNKKRTIHLAHLLLPRFISQKKDGFSDLGKVLIKIMCTPH